MPIFEYTCPCGKTFEELILRPSDEKEVRCPACQGTEVERVISRPNKKRPGKWYEGGYPKKVR